MINSFPYAAVYLDSERRIKLYKDGGFCQERKIKLLGLTAEWYLADDEDWPETEQLEKYLIGGKSRM